MCIRDSGYTIKGDIEGAGNGTAIMTIPVGREEVTTGAVSYTHLAQAILNNTDYFGDTDTDWLDLVLRTGVTQNLDRSVAGGGVNSRYYTSLSYTGQEGTLIKTDFQRISGKISLDSDISKYFRLNTNLNFGYTKSNITNGVYGQALYAPPTFAPYNEDGTYAILELGYNYQGYQNPLAVASCTNQAKTYTFMGSVEMCIRDRQ